VRHVLAVEVLAASQALDLRADVAAPGAASSAVHAAVRAAVPVMDEDRNVSDQLETVAAMQRELVDAAEAAVGALA
jgi:histidine ammonia-lyase